ncbi:uncharacterized protein STEHIDRAFT_115951 [Stereum hirsutum FP-91666 SS1]|uniref:Uncharacterized protein n=1 Tax=Stereum hirsutum (strain FP-91666) TaxID=721885 RepID=R7RXJ6_STEHR|nr:uncharacterized protein STEHIDRAFT_115951 [Stereum hirsutum FP-91666 SS1]EIM80054.1 hypothetical protein STEHIDRAFT_115951 [Stereum hirsutum FP-91666 SS1]
MSNNKNKRCKRGTTAATSSASQTPTPSKSAASSRDASPAQSPQPASTTAHPKPRRTVKLKLPAQPTTTSPDASEDDPLTPPPKVSRAEVNAAIQEVLGPVKTARSHPARAQSLPSDNEQVNVDQDAVEEEGNGERGQKDSSDSDSEDSDDEPEDEDPFTITFAVPHDAVETVSIESSMTLNDFRHEIAEKIDVATKYLSLSYRYPELVDAVSEEWKSRQMKSSKAKGKTKALIVELKDLRPVDSKGKGKGKSKGKGGKKSADERYNKVSLCDVAKKYDKEGSCRCLKMVCALAAP